MGKKGNNSSCISSSFDDISNLICTGKPFVWHFLNAIEINNHEIRLLHLDGYAIMHDIVRALLEYRKESVWIFQTQDFNEGYLLLEKQHFDILLIGISKTGPLGYEFPDHLQLLRKIRLRFPGLKIIVHSGCKDPRDIADIMNGGADSFISNPMGYEALLEAIFTVGRGQRNIGQQLFDLFKNSFEYLSGMEDTLIPKTTMFSHREIEVLNLIASGCSSKKISDILHIAAKTVETHRKNLMRKCKARNTAELISFSYSKGVL